MSIELALLGYLLDEPAHGYEIYQRLRAPDGLWQVWRMKQSQLYALLKSLEADGLIQSTIAPQSTRPARKMLALTEQGKATFLAWMHSPVDHGREMRIEFLAKLHFALQLDSNGVHSLITTQRNICRSWQEDLPRGARPQRDSAGNASPFSRSVALFRQTQIDAFVAFLDECEAFCVTETVNR